MSHEELVRYVIELLERLSNAESELARLKKCVPSRR
jgi:hypothetical protein